MLAAQTKGSRHRGIGNYSLGLARGLCEGLASTGEAVFLTADGAHGESVAEIRRHFSGVVPSHRIKTIHVPKCEPFALITKGSSAGLHAAALDWAYGKINPDVLHYSSIFENDVRFPSPAGGAAAVSSTTLYDLIPFVYSDRYLSNPVISGWYHDRLLLLKRFDLLFSISASARNDAIKHLSIDPARIVNIMGACDARFTVGEVSHSECDALWAKYGIRRPFLMFTGGADWRKNLEGAIRSYALLDGEIRRRFCLAIVCAVNPTERSRLRQLAASCGLSDSDLIITGFVSNEDLLSLYRTAHAFVFPSFYEGFGLPPLEAMSCGVPTIVADNSSLPEIVGRRDALFDAGSDWSIAEAMHKVLTDESYRRDLREKGLERAKLFTWERSASLVISAWRDAFAAKKAGQPQAYAIGAPHLRMAFVSPLPPEKSGIADYSAELLRDLGAHFEIDLFTTAARVTDDYLSSSFRIFPAKELKTRKAEYDIVVYQVGNSDFHAHMFDLMNSVPGVVVLHDFYLSGVMAHINAYGGGASRALNGMLNAGGTAVIEGWKYRGRHEALFDSPCNESVFESALGVIVHSKHSLELLAHYKPEGVSAPVYLVPHLRQVNPGASDASAKSNAREALKIDADEVVVCSFGHLAETKCIETIISGFDNLCRGRNHRFRMRLVFAGNLASGEYADKVKSLLNSVGCSDRVNITGFLDEGDYRRWLLAADMAIQLRQNTRGETSGAVLDCMSCGVPVIVNDYAGFKDYPADCVHFIATVPSVDGVSSALAHLADSLDVRRQLGEKSKSYLQDNHHPVKIAAGYRDAIFDALGKARCRDFSKLRFAHMKSASIDADTFGEWCERLTAEEPVLRASAIFIDITNHADGRAVRALDLREALVSTGRWGAGTNFIPVRRDKGADEYEVCVLSPGGGVDGLGIRVRFQHGDSLLLPGVSASAVMNDAFWAHLGARGIVVYGVELEIKTKGMIACFNGA